ncbi:MAG: hypothetical protein QXY22_05720 [Candidatus Nitrosotenuis sp.]
MSEKIWHLAVIAALSSLLILAYFTLMPILDKQGTVEQTQAGLEKAVKKFDELREEHAGIKNTLDGSGQQ